MLKQLHANESLLITLDLCRLHYQALLIIYLKFTAKNVNIKTMNLSGILLDLKITNYIAKAKNVKKTVKSKKRFN